MPEQADEQADWDIMSGVGITALGAASARAIETLHDNPLVTDPYAAEFVRTANAQLTKAMPVTPGEAAAEPDMPYLPLAHYVGVRSKFFDTYFTGAAAAGVRQAVILASGLDTRAFRLDWPAGTTVFEVDAPQVLAFKNAVLSGSGAQPRCQDRRAVTADLREDWAAALRREGFDPQAPTAWLAEGLFMYLRDDAAEALLSQVHRLSAPGSRAALDLMPLSADGVRTAAGQAVAERVDADVVEMWAADKNHDPAGWLRSHGWAVSAEMATALADRYGRPMAASEADMMPAATLISAARTA